MAVIRKRLKAVVRRAILGWSKGLRHQLFLLLFSKRKEQDKYGVILPLIYPPGFWQLVI